MRTAFSIKGKSLDGEYTDPGKALEESFLGWGYPAHDRILPAHEIEGSHGGAERGPYVYEGRKEAKKALKKD